MSDADRCESWWAGHRCDKDAGHTGTHYSVHAPTAVTSTETTTILIPTAVTSTETTAILMEYGISWPNLDAEGRPR